MHLLVTNPPPSRRRKARRRRGSRKNPPTAIIVRKARRRRVKKAATKARRRARNVATRVVFAASRSAPKMARRRRRSKTARRRRSSRRSGFTGGRGVGGFISKDMLKGVGIGAAGFVASNLLVDRIPVAALKSGRGRAVGKALVGIAGGFILRKAGMRVAGNAFATGAMTAAAIDLYQSVRSGGTAGLGSFGFDPGIPSLPAGGYDLSGLGLLEDQYVVQ